MKHESQKLPDLGECSLKQAELDRAIGEGQIQADRGELLDGPKVFEELFARNAARLRKTDAD